MQFLYAYIDICLYKNRDR